MTKLGLMDRIRDTEAKIVVIGLGYVGLPLAVEFAKKGFGVCGIERNQERVGMVNRGENYIPDVLIHDLADVVSSGNLHATAEFSVVAGADVVIVCVPTPLDKNKQPVTTYIEHVIDESLAFMHARQLVVLESTTYPKTTEEIIQPRIESIGLTVGEDVFLAFSPERIDPGNPLYKTSNTPKVVGGVTGTCTKHAKALYEQIIDAGVFPVSSPRAAEMTKILENVFRIVNISLVNELALLCERMEIDIWEVIEAAKTKPFGFMPFYPGPGLGGHCIPLDPFYLSWKAKEYDFTTRFIELAGEINDNMPYHVVEQASAMLNKDGKPLYGAHVLLVGVAYKRDIDDLRMSPALKILLLLSQSGAIVSYHDPFIEHIEHEGLSLKSQLLEPELLRRQDLALIVTDHSCIDYQMIVEHSGRVYDTRNATQEFKGTNRLGVG